MSCMERLKLDINVGGNLQGLEQLINKMKKAEAQMARLAELGKEDKLTSLISTWLNGGSVLA